MDLTKTFGLQAVGARTLTELSRRFSKYLEQFGIDDFGYAPIDPAGQPVRGASATTWNAEFLDFFYREGVLDIDPTFAEALSRPQPFQWTRLVQGREIDPRALQAMGRAAEMGLADGITIAIPGPRGCVAVLDLTVRQRGPVLGEALDRHLPALYLAALEFHACSMALHQRHGPEPAEAVLTDRERECCVLLARGMSTEQIGHRMNITERTVAFHVGNVRRKLKAGSRSHAVSLLIARREIHP